MYKVLKRTFCIIFSSIAIVVLSPLFVFAIVGIFFSDRTPVLYKAKRLGKDNKEFSMLKFRTMRTQKQSQNMRFTADESRIFRFGALLRKTKIDELPQLFNCLKGDMAFVGPRPVDVQQASIMHEGKYAECAKFAHGLTSPAALYDYIYGDSISNEAEYQQKVLPTRKELEYLYTQKASLCFDCKILAYTFLAVCHIVPKERMLKMILSL